MNEVIVISVCEKVVKTNKLCGYEFHFRGFFKGEKINKINVRTRETFSIGEEYLLFLEIEDVLSLSLNTKLIQSTELKKISFPN
ncbi:hypothetical protein BIY24_00750 [Halobacteriovorax marinus]|uniref:Uncharacterized protein n=1 Tax=Halobacteriovorax marinus (strain ATCC BAA-682 / DSM 15412 / SJ) TaxID=862908 RepID=E1X2P2_HALMS|nr:hypothetical protein [Halobacteriovorax marinus]ATH06521.1 hypothetical protein BIY24_00750 [Halobacteriovorax marinus]CBW25087.1 hypothetical protein BMS_0150 [Halobacteriovorax marinus SJ]